MGSGVAFNNSLQDIVDTAAGKSVNGRGTALMLDIGKIDLI